VDTKASTEHNCDAAARQFPGKLKLKVRYDSPCGADQSAQRENNTSLTSAKQFTGKLRLKVRYDSPCDANQSAQHENNTSLRSKEHRITDQKENRGAKRVYELDETSDGDNLIAPVMKTNVRSKLAQNERGGEELAREDRIHEDWLNWETETTASNLHGDSFQNQSKGSHDLRAEQSP
jgi:hypothetical protein